MAKSKQIVEFGDFQTPLTLAKEVVSVINAKEHPGSIIEPTCGLGAFLEACIDAGVSATKLTGWEINPQYVSAANKSLCSKSEQTAEIVTEQDFFKINWLEVREKYEAPVLFIGNPPWVTNSELGKLLSNNLPEKYNFHNLTGLEAMTGKSNFDISEWMLIKLIEYISGTDSALAFLIKTSVAIKLLQYISKRKMRVSGIYFKKIDAQKHFNVSVDACLFYASGTKSSPQIYECDIYDSLEALLPYKTMGVIEKKLVSDINAYKSVCQIDRGSEFNWRSGVKHDASDIMEFDLHDHQLTNGLSEVVDPCP